MVILKNKFMANSLPFRLDIKLNIGPTRIYFELKEFTKVKKLLQLAYPGHDYSFKKITNMDTGTWNATDTEFDNNNFAPYTISDFHDRFIAPKIIT